MMYRAILVWAMGLLSAAAFGQLQDSPWPMFHHDLRHTGESPYVGPDTPRLKWAYETETIRSSAAVGADGTIYVGAHPRTLYAFNPDGTVKWRFAAGGPILASPAISADGTVYVGTDENDGTVHAVDSTGNLKWSYLTGGNIVSSAAIGPGGTIYVGSDDRSLYAINPDGTLKWTFATGHYVCSSPAIGPDSTIYVGSDDCNLYAINPDGSLKWSYPFQSFIRSSPAIGSDGTIYINPNREDTGLYAINPNGTLKWRCDTLALRFDGYRSVSSPGIDRDGVIYVGADSPRGLFAINPDGTLKWWCPLTDPSASSPAVDAHKTTYIGCSSGRLYAVDSMGTLKWTFDTGADVYTSPAIDDRRTAYIGNAGAERSGLLAIGFLRDVAPVSIVSPGDTVCVDATYNPQALVKNVGDTLESFNVECIIDTAGQAVYGDTLPVADLSAGDTTLVTFEGWTVGPDPGVSYTVTVVTLLRLDDRRSNDTLAKMIISVLPPGIEEIGNDQLPMTNVQLMQNVPNPFFRETQIAYRVSPIAETGDAISDKPLAISLSVYDLSGRLVRTLVDGSQGVGQYPVEWDGKDASGRRVSPGIYMYRLCAGDCAVMKKMVLLR